MALCKFCDAHETVIKRQTIPQGCLSPYLLRANIYTKIASPAITFVACQEGAPSITGLSMGFDINYCPFCGRRIGYGSTQ